MDGSISYLLSKIDWGSRRGGKREEGQEESRKSMAGGDGECHHLPASMATTFIPSLLYQSVRREESRDGVHGG